MKKLDRAQPWAKPYFEKWEHLCFPHMFPKYVSIKIEKNLIFDWNADYWRFFN